MRQSVRAIVVRDGRLLVMKRNKFGKQYYTLIGGGVDAGETLEQSLVRELFEETGMVAQAARLVFVEQAGDPYGDQYVFLCDGVTGEPTLSPASEEYKISRLGQNTYEPMWLTLADLPTVPFLSEALKQRIMKGLGQGFPTQVETFNPAHAVL